MREIITLLEANSKPQDIEIIELNFTDREVAPVMSKTTIDLHYGKLAHGYADRYNNNEGDKEFNYAGAFLHNTLFPQFRETRNSNKPNGPMLGFVDKHFGSYDELQSQIEETALSLQGSGWVYLARNGQIKTIKNHVKRTDIVVLIDMWEHSYQHDYASDKAGYLDNIWRIINWEVVSQRC